MIEEHPRAITNNDIWYSPGVVNVGNTKGAEGGLVLINTCGGGGVAPMVVSVQTAESTTTPLGMDKLGVNVQFAGKQELKPEEDEKLP